MPTRPVTWELDVPPEAAPEVEKVAAPASEIPSIAALRSALIGGRFELLKVGAFAAFLFSFVAISLHGSQLTNSENQFAADTSAAFDGLAHNIAIQTGALASSLDGKTSQLTSSAMQSASLAVDQMTGAWKILASSSSPSSTEAPAPMPAPTRHHRRSHHTNPGYREATSGHIEKVAFVSHRHHRRHPASQGYMPGDPIPFAEGPAPIQWSGNLLDLPDFLSAEGTKAAEGGVSLVQESVELVGLNSLRNSGQVMMSSLGEKFDVTHPENFALGGSSSLFSALLSPQTAVAAGAAVLAYMFFVVVLGQLKGSMRSAAGARAA